MKVVGFTGLHGSGKTYAAEVLQHLSGWCLIPKIKILQDLHSGGWERSSPEDWNTWYQELYARIGVEAVLRKVLERAIGRVCIIDAVHSPTEWRYIMTLHPKALLVGVFAPGKIRVARRQEPEFMDVRRIKFWHADTECLQSYVEWAISGILSSTLLESNCRELMSYVESS